MSDQHEEQGDNSIGSLNDAAGDAGYMSEAESYPLTFRSLMFWAIVVALGLLGTCIVVAIFLALIRGS